MDQVDLTRRIAMLSPLALALAAGAARAQDFSDRTGDSANIRLADASATADASPSTEAYAAALRRVEAATATPFTGDADVDFVRAMIPLHQAAIGMAKAVRDYGDDADVRSLAETLIAQRQTELDWMTDWLHRHAAR